MPLNSNNLLSYYTYEAQVIVSFGFRQNVEKLANKWKINHPNNPCIIIDGYDLIDNPNRVKALPPQTGITRIYIYAHCHIAKEYFVGENQDYIIYIEELVKHLKTLIGDREVIINLLSCFAGRGAKHLDIGTTSTASILQAELYKQTKRNIPVVARMHQVTILPTGKRATFSITATQHPEGKEKVRYNFFTQQPGSKVTYALDDKNQQIKFDSYYHSWKRKVIEALIAINKQITNNEKRAFISNWIDLFKQSSPDRIFELMNTEINNHKTILNSPYTDIQIQNKATYNIVIVLVLERELILSGKHTFSELVHTGRNADSNLVSQHTEKGNSSENDCVVGDIYHDQISAFLNIKSEEIKIPARIKTLDDVLDLNNERIIEKILMNNNPSLYINNINELLLALNSLHSGLRGLFLIKVIHEITPNKLLDWICNADPFIFLKLQNQLNHLDEKGKAYFASVFSSNQLIQMSRTGLNVLGLMRILPITCQLELLCLAHTHQFRYTLKDLSSVVHAIDNEVFIDALNKNYMAFENVSMDNIDPSVTKNRQGYKVFLFACVLAYANQRAEDKQQYHSFLGYLQSFISSKKVDRVTEAC